MGQGEGSANDRPGDRSGAVGSPQDVDQTHKSVGAERLLKLLDSGKTAGVAAAGVVYLSFNWFYTSIYGRFGVAPGEVGHDRADVLTHVATGLLIIGGFAVGVAALWYRVLTWKRSRPAHEPRRRTKARSRSSDEDRRPARGRKVDTDPIRDASDAALAAYSAYLTVPILLVVGSLMSGPLINDDIVLGAIALSFAPVVLATRQLKRTGSVALSVVPVIAAYLVIGVVVMHQWTNLEIREIERSATSSKPTTVNPPLLLRLLFDVRVTPVCLNATSALPSDGQGPFLLLGQHAGTLVLVRRGRS